MRNNSIIILGAGARGLALGHILNHNGKKVTIFEFNKQDCERLDQERITAKLPGFQINKNIVFTNEISDIINNKIIINAIPTQHIRKLMKNTNKNLWKDKIIINASKGIETNTGKLIHEIFKEEISIDLKDYYSLSGASFAHEICLKNAKTDFILTNINGNIESIKELFENDFCHIKGDKDIIGVELAGALKNIYAIGAGILDGKGISINSKAIFFLDALNEMKKIGKHFGANTQTFDLTCGLGDLYISCNSSLSRNWQVGNKLGKGEILENILKNMNMISEGSSTVKIIYEIGKKYNLDIDICDWIYSYLYQGENDDGLGWLKIIN